MRHLTGKKRPLIFARRVPGRGRGHSAGVSLVELMIAIAIGLLVLTALAAMFAYNSNARREIDATTRQIENGRYAMELLRDDVHEAGYFSLFSGAGATKQVITACIPRTGVALSTTNLGWQAAATSQMPLSVYGYAAGDLPAGESCITNQKANTDVLILRRVESESKAVSSITGSSFASEYYMQTTGCGNSSVDSTSTPFVIASGGSGATAAFTLHNKDCTTIAPVQKIVVRAFYVATCSNCGGSGDGIPTLRMVHLTGGATANVPLVEGIESMRLEYSLDTNADGIVDTIKRCKTGVDACTLADWGNVIAVQARLLSRNTERTIGYSDPKSYDMGLAGAITPSTDSANFPVGYRRHLYAAKIIAFNQAGSRE